MGVIKTIVIGKNILLISPETWGPNHVSKHHYALELAKRENNVVFLNPPGKGFNREEILPNLTILDYCVVIKGVRFMPYWISAFITRKDIQRIEQYIGVKFDVIWNFDSSRFFNLSSLNGKLRICHIVDMVENIRRDLLAKTSDVCLCTSDFIADKLQPFNRNVFKINHGYQRSGRIGDVSILGNQAKLKVGYIGNLGLKYIDWDLTLELIQTLPDLEFHFIGSYKESNLSKSGLNRDTLTKLKENDNIFLQGQKESNTLHSYLKHFDILINIYLIKSEEDKKQLSNPHKIMEYLGSGKIILSTYVDEYKDKRHLMEMVDNREEFIPRFMEVISNLDQYNSTSKQNERIRFALDNTYEKQVDRIDEIINTL